MRKQFTPAGIRLLEIDAKALRRGTSLSPIQALDQIARREHWDNWALLKKNAIPPTPSECLDMKIEPFLPGDPGVFLVKLSINDAKTLEKVDKRGGLSFELPAAPPRWILREFSDRTKHVDPYFDRGPLQPRGRFVNGIFLCIVSVNGVEPRDVDAVLAAGLMPIGMAIRMAATEALAVRLNAPADPPVRLFVSRRGANGLCTIDDQYFSSVEEAQRAEFPDNVVPISIRAESGSWMYQAPFGWQETAA